jgi:hypothetical protein
MASFRTHFSVGIASGVLSAFAVTSLALVPNSWSFAILIALAVTLGAQMPDMDSDSGLPFHITFSSLSLVTAVLTGMYVWQNYPSNYLYLVIAPLLAFVLVWGVIGTIFKRFTRHRGMAHSVPAAVLAGLLSFACSSWLGFADWQAFLFGIAISVGYVIHLILDEIWAGFNFHGQLFVPNKAFGSALKFISHDRRLTIAVYAAIAIMIYVNFENFQSLTMRLIAALSL